MHPASTKDSSRLAILGWASVIWGLFPPPDSNIALFFDLRTQCVFSILAAYSKGNSSFIGGNELKNKESNRIKSLYEGLKSCKVKIIKKRDGLKIFGNGKNNVAGGAKIRTYYDHRIAMVFLVMGLASEKKIIIDNTNCIKTSFPNFLKSMKQIKTNLSHKN